MEPGVVIGGMAVVLVVWGLGTFLLDRYRKKKPIKK